MSGEVVNVLLALILVVNGLQLAMMVDLRSRVSRLETRAMHHRRGDPPGSPFVEVG